MVEKTLNDFIGNIFSVNLILVCSKNAKELNIDLPTLFKRFTQINSLNAIFRDPVSSCNVPISTLFAKFRDLSELNFSLNSATMKKILAEGVTRYDPFSQDNPLECPWFAEWKSLFLNHFECCDHEFVGANFGCVFVITSSDLANFKQILADLSQNVKQQPTIRWFQPNFFRYYVVINDKVDRPDHGDQLGRQLRTFYEEINMIYGSSLCYWLDVSAERDIEIVTQVVQKMEKIQVSEHPLSESAYSEVEEKREIVHKKSLLMKVDTLVRELLINALIPWTEKQIKHLNESISLRKGLRRSIFSATKQLLAMSNTVPAYRSGNGQTSIIYSTEANEMQSRKVADMAMCLRLYELAQQFYSNAKKEFHTEGAWLYYAGACEASAIASYLMNKLQKQDFDIAINCYLDTCKSSSLATRTALLATDIIRKIWPIEASQLFIKLTSEEHNLKSALFLEQAARCLLQSLPPRKRRAAFHYVLAGNRYNRCGMKRHALYCYLKYDQTHWRHSSDHVQFMVARLYLQLNPATDDAPNVERLKGLQILKNNGHKEQFYTEFLKEIAKDPFLALPRNLFEVDFPFVRHVLLHVPEGSNKLKPDGYTCFVTESVELQLTLWNAFKITLNSVRLICTSNQVQCESKCVMLDEAKDMTINLHLTPMSNCSFEITSFEFQIGNVLFTHNLLPKQVQKLTAITALPRIDMLLQMNDQELDALELYTGEIVDLSFQLLIPPGWTPNSMKLVTNANLLNENGISRSLEEGVHEYVLQHDEKRRFQMQAPFQAKNYSLYFRIEYTEGSRSRCLTKRLELYVHDFLQVECSVPELINVRNILSLAELTITMPDQETLCLLPGQTAYLLLQSNDRQAERIHWKTSDRLGFIELAAGSFALNY